MRFLAVKGSSRVKGNILLPGDKSISSRSIIISAISRGKTTIRNFSFGKDPLNTINVFRRLGVKIISDRPSKTVIVFGSGLSGLKKPKGDIFTGDSGTTLRLTLGVLAGQDFSSTLTAGKSLSRRPMLRVTAPLRKMGADIKSRLGPCGSKMEEYAPITIKGGCLAPITYRLPVASAQVKSAILLAGLYANGKTRIIEPLKTRDHTERMLRLFKAGIKTGRHSIVIENKGELRSPGRILIPGDISSASFLIVLTAILPGSSILIKNISLNPERSGIIGVLKRMGADIRISSRGMAGFEPIGNISVRSSQLKGAVINKKEIPSLIDELPVLMVAASFAKGKSVFKGVDELRAKETDRITSMTRNLKKMGVDIEVVNSAGSEKILIRGGAPLTGAKVSSFGDHRTAMSMIVAALAAEGATFIDDISCINKSFPDFLSLLKALIR
ncbi:MAG: 3-phosphoshikimate 1-carboxyvinyltransferase [Candidatus Omnitrophota bacterium]|jgi:3-phosphoshikimate 1-carboxyvinyltransferase